jgi:hypothetical protein
MKILKTGCWKIRELFYYQNGFKELIGPKKDLPFFIKSQENRKFLIYGIVAFPYFYANRATL